MAISPIKQPYLLMVGDTKDPSWAKTAFGLRDWMPNACAAQYRFDPQSVDLGLKDMTPAQAMAAGIKTLVIGITAPGGNLPQRWVRAVADAASAGLDIASGMHQRLDDIAEIAQAAAQSGVTIHNVRHGDPVRRVGTGRRRTGRRLLTVGTDCAVGKKYTALTLAKEMQRRGMDAAFRATGQTGILISGEGIAIDAVVADFISGTAEMLSPMADAGHWDVIEGQGSLFHPSYAGVTLGLIHGSQPDAMVLCHHPERTAIRGLAHMPMPGLAEAMGLYLSVARLTNPDSRFVGIALNTSSLQEADAHMLLRRVESEFGLPCVDPIRTGVAAILDELERTLAC